MVSRKETWRETPPQIVFSPDERYAIVDHKEVIQLPSRKPVELTGQLLAAYPGHGILIGVFNSWPDLFRLVVFSSFNWTTIAQFNIETIPGFSPSGRYVVIKREVTYDMVTTRPRFFDLFSVPSMKLWILLLSLLHAKAPLVTQGCFHPVVVCRIFKYFTPYSLPRFA